MHDATPEPLSKSIGSACHEEVFTLLFGPGATPWSTALEHVVASRQRNVEAFTQTLTDRLACCEFPMARSLAEHARDPKKAGAIFEALRQLFAASSSEAAPALAVLLAKHLADGARPSLAFCGCARLFADLHDDEFSALRRLVERVDSLDLAQSLPAVHLMSVPRSADPRGRAEVRVFRPAASPSHRGAASEFISLGIFAHVTRLFHLFKVHGLGHDAPFPGRSRATRKAASSIFIDFERIHQIRDAVAAHGGPAAAE